MRGTSSPSPLGQESVQPGSPSPAIPGRRSGVESRLPLPLSSAREGRNLNPNHKETSPGSRPIPRQSWSPLLAARYS